MSSEKERAETHQTHDHAPFLVCPKCRAEMVGGMRFCRFCGYRLGEGVEEFAETRLLEPDAPRRAQTPTQPQPQPTVTAQEWGATPTASHDSSASAANTPRLKTSSLPSAGAGQKHWVKSLCRPTKRNWLIWGAFALVLFAVVDDATRNASAPQLKRQRAAATGAAAGRSYLGASLDDGDGGVLVEAVTPPGSPADRAGLVGGDVITVFDGAPVPYEKDLLQRLGATPVGKTVEIEYLRDGQLRKTTLATISLDERSKLEEAFEERPEGEGFLGVDIGDLKRVPVEGQGIHGVRLGKVHRNRPGDTAGLRQGDIIVEFDGVPIRTVAELLARIDRALPDSIVKIALFRDGQRLELPVKMGED